ncbi:MAG: anion transporter [Planctomycetes bacterium]|nr:anion transporter [Planctomycetota bacterium]
MATALVIFLVTYAGVAIGRIPGLMLDRTGIALLGAIAMVVSGAVPLPQAVHAIDVSTILLLYALMILSAQLRLGGFYTRTALRIAALTARPRSFLLILMLVSAVLSAVLANDIVCLAFTPVLCAALLRVGLNPVPFLLGLAVSSNIGSAATIIGNPQNMLIGQMGRLPFGAFLLWCTPPALLALAGSYVLLLLCYRRRWAFPPAIAPDVAESAWPAFNAWQSSKGLAAAGLLVALFFTDIPRELSAIAVAGLLLCSRRMKSRRIIELVDWHLLTLFCALFVVIEGIEAARVPDELVAGLAGHGVNLQDPLTLTGVSALVSNVVSNVPATMLLVRFLDPLPLEPWYVLAVATTFAGNLIAIGSIANLIVLEQARRAGIEIGFWTHARVGLPVTAWSLLVLVVWILL